MVYNISKLTNLCCPFRPFSWLFHLFSREKIKKAESFSAAEKFKYFLRLPALHQENPMSLYSYLSSKEYT